jgi:hypothetical protein
MGFEPMIPAFERAKTVHASDCAANVIGPRISGNHVIRVCEAEKNLVRMKLYMWTALVIFALINSSALHETGGIKVALAHELKRLRSDYLAGLRGLISIHKYLSGNGVYHYHPTTSTESILE